MAEISRWWDGTTIGDAANYTDLNWAETEVWKFTKGEGHQGIISGIGWNYLALATPAPFTDVYVQSGAALVNGRLYYNDGNTANFTVSGVSKWWLVGLFSDESAHTIRSFCRGPYNTEALAMASIVQTPGGDWEIATYTFQTTAGGLVDTTTVNDRRIYAFRSSNQIFVQSEGGRNVTDSTDIHRGLYGVAMPNSKVSSAFGHFYVPHNFLGSISFEPLLIPNATGDVYSEMYVDFEQLGKGVYNAHSITRGYAADGVVDSTISKLSLAGFGSTWLSDVKEGGGDLCCITSTRDAISALDTVNNTIYLCGWRVYFSALY
jgi:hypothetical protein